MFAQDRVVFCPEALNDESQVLAAKIVLRPVHIHRYTFGGESHADLYIHFPSVFGINGSARHTSKAGKKRLRKCIDRINRNFLPWWSMRCGDLT